MKRIDPQGLTPAEREALASALVHLRRYDDPYETINGVRRVPVNRVLFSPWNPGRLDRARTKLAAGLKAPPINVDGITVRDDTWYLVSDGMHRSAAAMEAGRRTIVAEIGTMQQTYPDQHRLVFVEQADVWELLRRTGGTAATIEGQWTAEDPVLVMLKRYVETIHRLTVWW